MTIDEFLVSNEVSHEFDRDYVLKVRYNDNIDYIFKTNYGKLYFNKDLKCVGLFNKSNNKLYGASYAFNGTFNKDMYSNFYSGTIEQIRIDLYKNADKLLNNYIQDNSKSLREIAKETFDKFISHKEDYNSIKENAVKNYIYQLDNDTLEFKVNTSKYERSSDINKLMMKYLEFPEETEYKVFEEYINNEEKTEYLYSRVLGIANIELTVREKIGERLLEKDLEDKLIVELKNDPTNEYKIKHDIIESIKDIDAQMLTINLCHNGKEISFKYPKDQLYNFWLSDYHIQEVSKREEIKQMYKDERGFDDFHLEDIKSISFRKQILYENNKELELNNEKEEPDIVDDMFD